MNLFSTECVTEVIAVDNDKILILNQKIEFFTDIKYIHVDIPDAHYFYIETLGSTRSFKKKKNVSDFYT